MQLIKDLKSNDSKRCQSLVPHLPFDEFFEGDVVMLPVINIMLENRLLGSSIVGLKNP